MFRHLIATAVVSFGIFAAATPLPAKDRYTRLTPDRKPRFVAATPMQDDANLHDVRFVGTSTGFAVGDRGVIWKTVDGGRNWGLLKSPVTCPLRSVCFLTDRVGWIVGGGTVPYTRIGYGVVLFTRDGGNSWEVLVGKKYAKATVRQHKASAADDRRSPRRRTRGIVGPGHSSIPSALTGNTNRSDGESADSQAPRAGTRGPGSPPYGAKVPLPSLVYVKFFTLNHGVVVGDASTGAPSGILLTEDGGRTWKPMPGKLRPGWRTAAFLSPRVGFVGGMHGRMSVIGGGRLLKPAVENPGLRALRGIALNRDDSGWLVGEGGLVLKTESGGVIWKTPPTQLPKGLNDVADFHAVASRGDKVWIAGSPGSVIWHSDDGGKTWSRQLTGQTVPIHAITFINDRVGWAVGALGTITATFNGGRTWVPVRGKNRRAAFLAIHSRQGNVSFPLLAKLSGDQGFRGIVLQTAREDYSPDGPAPTSPDLRLRQAVADAGASAAVIDWRFPVALPGLERNDKRLWDDWNRRSEGRLRQVLSSSLVAKIRTWRPNVVILDHADDALTRLINREVLRAIRQAAETEVGGRRSEVGGQKSEVRGQNSEVGKGRSPRHPVTPSPPQDPTGLKPWKVDKVYIRLTDGSSGDAYVSPHEYLYHLGETNHVVAAKAETKLRSAARPAAKREAYRLVLDRTSPAEKIAAHRDFFKGLHLWPGSAARRKLAPIDDADAERQMRLARRQRNFQAIADHTLEKSRAAAQMIAQLDKITDGMKPERAATQLVQLADDYRRRSQWELAEATWIEAVVRYPNASASLEAMQRLFHLWIGAEPVWHRVSQIGVTRSRLTADGSTLQNRLQRAAELTKVPATMRDARLLDLGPDPAKLRVAPDSHALNRNAQRRLKGVRHWQDQALRMAELIRKRDPELYLSPRIQFPLAALLRSRGSLRAAQQSYQQFQKSRGSDGWKVTADGEMWMLAPTGRPPKATALCARAESRPKLDGILSDDCWQTAKVIRLTTARESHRDLRQEAFVMLSYDGDYLYVAGNAPIAISPEGSDAKTEKRKRDADLSSFDRFALHLDIDRDYATYFTLEVDQRGWTSDACWGDKSWNPRWFVAHDKDEKAWRFEAAIPLKELGPGRPHRGILWSVGIVRTVPAVGVQSWTHPVDKTPRAKSFGLLRFD